MDKQYLTLNWIINSLGKDGCNSKGIVREALERASLTDLLFLKRSINEEIRNRKAEIVNEKR